MNNFEHEYKNMVGRILTEGELREGRNGNTLSLFGEVLHIEMEEDHFPLLIGRKVYHQGVFGELAALLREPKHIDDFKEFGCNYWGLWAQEDGSINVDYGNKWLDWNGVNQLETVIDTIKNNPTDRRMLISGWDPSNLENLDLPCCHYMYQWYVRDGRKLDMIWNQRSVDTMIGLPSDIVFASAWNIMMANETELEPGKITMMLGDTHIYEEHIENAERYMEIDTTEIDEPRYRLTVAPGFKTTDFTPQSIEVFNYEPAQILKFKLKG